MRAECSPVIKHAICSYPILTSWASSEENETNTQELVFPLKLESLFSFYGPPMSPLLALKLSDTVLNSVLKLAEAPNNIISTCFSKAELQSCREYAISSKNENWKQSRVCLAICPDCGKGHSESMSEQKICCRPQHVVPRTFRGNKEAGMTW